MGRLTRDPELKRTVSGISVTSFTIAVERDFKGNSGQKETDYIDIVAWRSTAEFVSKYFSKGRMAVVEGRIQIREYAGKSGEKKKAFEVIAENVYFGDSKKTEASGAQYGGDVPDFSAPPGEFQGPGEGDYDKPPF
jgi:single-strand DNA-binding protein